MDGKWISDQLIRTGRTQADLGRYLKLAPSIVNKMVKGKREIKAREADDIRTFFSVDAPARRAEMHITDAVQAQPSPATLPSKSEMLRDVPLLGTAFGGDAGDFVMGGEDGDYVRRPPALQGRTDVFALFVRGDSMSPRYNPGELIYLERRRPPQNGDYVVVEMKPGPDGSQPAYLKQLVATTATKLRLLQHNPEKIIEIERKLVLQILRVLTLIDMLGM